MLLQKTINLGGYPLSHPSGQISSLTHAKDFITCATKVMAVAEDERDAQKKKKNTAKTQWSWVLDLGLKKNKTSARTEENDMDAEKGLRVGTFWDYPGYKSPNIEDL